MPVTTRRKFFARSAAAATAVAKASAMPRPPRVLLRSSWQSVNIGDVGHTPGALDLLANYFPEAEITLWAGGLGNGAREMLAANYPKLTFVEGGLGAGDKPSNPALARAWAEADLYLSGSGSGFPASNHALAFRKATGKPVGVFGVSTDPISGIGGNREPEGGTLDEIRAKAARLSPTHLSAGPAIHHRPLGILFLPGYHLSRLSAIAAGEDAGPRIRSRCATGDDVAG